MTPYVHFTNVIDHKIYFVDIISFSLIYFRLLLLRKQSSDVEDILSHLTNSIFVIVNECKSILFKSFRYALYFVLSCVSFHAYGFWHFKMKSYFISVDAHLYVITVTSVTLRLLNPYLIYKVIIFSFY